MELIGIGGKNNTDVAVDWARRISTDKGKESVRTAADTMPKSREIPAREYLSTSVQEKAKALADRIMAFLDASRYSLQFIPNPESGQATIRVLDSSGKVIRQIPPEEIDLLSLQTGSITGLLVDERLG